MHKLFSVLRYKILHFSLRRKFLENWLTSLCNHSAVVVSPELREFLAYGDDGKIAFAPGTGKPGILKIDKVKRISSSKCARCTMPFSFFKLLAKTVSGVITSIKDALPNFEEESNSFNNYNGASSTAPNNNAFATDNNNALPAPASLMAPHQLLPGPEKEPA